MNSYLAICGLLKDINFILEDGERKLFADFDLNLPRFYALKHIGENPGISLSKLSTLMLSDKGNISRIVRGMEAAGLVVRQRDAADGRALRLYLSEEGDRIGRSALAARDRLNHQRLSGLERDVDQLYERLLFVRELLANEHPGADRHA